MHQIYVASNATHKVILSKMYGKIINFIRLKQIFDKQANRANLFQQLHIIISRLCNMQVFAYSLSYVALENFLGFAHSYNGQLKIVLKS